MVGKSGLSELSRIDEQQAASCPSLGKMLCYHPLPGGRMILFMLSERLMNGGRISVGLLSGRNIFSSWSTTRGFRAPRKLPVYRWNPLHQSSPRWPPLVASEPFVSSRLVDFRGLGRPCSHPASHRSNSPEKARPGFRWRIRGGGKQLVAR